MLDPCLGGDKGTSNAAAKVQTLLTSEICKETAMATIQSVVGTGLEFKRTDRSGFGIC